MAHRVHAGYGGGQHQAGTGRQRRPATGLASRSGTRRAATEACPTAAEPAGPQVWPPVEVMRTIEALTAPVEAVLPAAVTQSPTARFEDEADSSSL